MFFAISLQPTPSHATSPIPPSSFSSALSFFFPLSHGTSLTDGHGGHIHIADPPSPIWSSFLLKCWKQGKVLGTLPWNLFVVMSTYVPYNRILFQRTLNVSGLYSKHNLHFLVFKLIRMMINGPIWSIHSSVVLNGSKNLFMTGRHIYLRARYFHHQLNHHHYYAEMHCMYN